MNNNLKSLLNLAELLNVGEVAPTQDDGGGMISRHAMGKYVIVRSRSEGINAGEVVEADETGVVLSNARRLWHHKPKVSLESWYEGVANHGLSDDSRLSGVVGMKVIVEDYSLTICTSEARQSIEAAVAHAQN